MLAALLLCAAPALAAGQRQHVFSFSFGSLGTGPGEFFHPSGVAVSSATGDVYVADRENGRLEEFKPVVLAGGDVVGETFVKAVAVGFPEAVAVDNCTQAQASNEACSETEDPSVGDVYVAAAKKGSKAELGEDEYLYKFNANLEEVWSKKLKDDIYGLAVSQSGGLFVYGQQGGISSFNDAVENAALPATSVSSAAKGAATRAFAVESNGNFYAGVLAAEEEAPAGSTMRELLYELSQEGVGLIAKLGGSTGQVLMHDLDYEEARAVAVNPTDAAANGVDEEDDVYVAEVGDVAGEQLSTIAAFGAAKGGGGPAEGEGELLQRFGVAGLKEGDGIAVDPSTGDVYVSDGASNRVDVFELEPAGKPTVAAVGAHSTEPPLTASNATTLTAEISPAGSPTRYYFEYGSAPCLTDACQSSAASSLAGEGFGNEQASVELLSLPAGIYHYRVVAENAHGKTQSSEQTFDVVDSLGLLPDGRAWEMVSPPNKDGAEPEAPTAEGGLIQASANGDAITYVADGPMPAEETPGGLRSPEFTQIISTRGLRNGREEWLAEDMNTPDATAAGTQPGAAPEYQFFSASLALSLVRPFPGETGPLASPPISPPLELHHKAVEEEGKREQENTPYLRDDRPLEPGVSEEEDYEKARENGERTKPQNAGFLPLVTKLNQPGPEFGEEANGKDSGDVVGIVPNYATPDLRHVGFSSERAGKGLYEWTGNKEEEGTLQAVSVLPNKTLVQSPEAIFGSVGHTEGTALDVRHAISNDGTLVFWSRENGQGIQLYVRDTQLQETLELSTEGPAKPDAIFQTASADGSKVYFTDTQPLTPESTATEASPNLYVAELEVVDGQLSSKLTDLTPQPYAGLVGGLDTKVIAASEEEGESGAYVYFVADGALAPGSARGHCSQEAGKEKGTRRAGTTCNLYVRHYNTLTATWEPTRLVAVLSGEDQPDWNIDRTNLEDLTSRASPNGGYLAFMSDRSLTGYDNEDASGLGRRDEEVYLYDAQRASLTCPSCNPSGGRPTGILDTHVSDGEGFVPVVDRPEVWSTEQETGLDPWLAASIPAPEHLDKARALHEPRYLSNDGRLFFNSADALQPAGSVTNEKRTKIERTQQYGELEVGIENVYEYEPAAVGNCHSEGGCVGLISSGKSEHESVFLEASESGNDAFFLTAEKLAPQDVDTNFDVYDAHVCESSSPCPPTAEQAKTPCDGEGCQGTGSGPPTLQAPASLSFSGSGNVVLPKQAVLPEKQSVPPVTVKQLTRAQKLKKALKACKKDKKKTKRLACEKQARKKYGPLHTKKSSSGASI
jgi:DNA-binding beta-propeller fold protein YncE